MADDVHRLTCPRQHPSRKGLRHLAGAGIRPLIPKVTAGERRSDDPGVSCRLSATGIGFLGILGPAQHRLPSRVAYHAARLDGADPAGVSTFHLREIRPGWVPPLLRGGGAHATGQHPPVATCRFPAASPQPRSCLPPSGASCDEAFRGSLAFTRPAFPSPVTPGWNQEPLGSTLGFGPRRYQRRPPRRGRAIEH